MNFYFYDLETFGINTRTSRIAQFAGVRTDENFNAFSTDMFYCKPSGDSLPDPESCFITNITPQSCQQQGLAEHQFIGKIITQFSQENTCVLGFNNIRFDDEFIRFTAWRNLLDPYAWSWQNGNSRFDLLDVVRFCYALKQNTSLKWAYDEIDGVKTPSFKLDKLAPANDIEHSQAHDALADVKATIELAKKIKQTQPELWGYAFNLRYKKTVAHYIKLLEPMLHTSGMYPPADACTKLTTALCYHPKYKERAIVYNLEQGPEILLNLSVEELEQRIFTKQQDLAQGQERLEIKELIFNRSPMFVASKNPPPQLGINSEQCLKNLEFIKQHHNQILPKIISLYEQQDFSNSADVDQQLYDGFLSNQERAKLDDISKLNAKQLADYKVKFSDKRLAKLLLHYKGRNFPSSLNESEKEQWFEVVQARFQQGKDDYLSIQAYFKKITVLAEHYPHKAKLWQELSQYGEQFA